MLVVMQKKARVVHSGHRLKMCARKDSRDLSELASLTEEVSLYSFGLKEIVPSVRVTFLLQSRVDLPCIKR